MGKHLYRLMRTKKLSLKFSQMMHVHDVSEMRESQIVLQFLSWRLVRVFAVILPFYKLLNAQTDEDKEQWSNKLHEAIRWINDRLEEYHPVQEGEKDAFVLGEELSIGDILVFPWIHRLPVVKHYRGFEVPDTDEFARFNKWVNALSNHPAIKATLTKPPEYFIEQYNLYASGERKV